MHSYIFKYIKENLELAVWVSVLGILFFITPENGHHTLCPLDNMGFDFCWGCGIGRSMHYFLIGEWTQSIEHHFAGWLAVLVILYRIIQLVRYRVFKIKI